MSRSGGVGVLSLIFTCSLLPACKSDGPGLAAIGAGSSLAASTIVAGSELPCAQRSDTRLAAMTDEEIQLTSALGLPPGRYAMPAGEPTQLVVMFHGHLNDSCSWRNHLRKASARGAVAVAMDYVRHTPIENYGWSIRQAAADSIAAARHFLTVYPSITRVIAFGVSMGGNAAGYAVASPEAVRADGSPLFDYWVNVEGVNNLIEEYLVIRALAPANEGAALAQQEIEEENGGPLEEAPDRYVETTNVFRVQDMSDLKGAVIVHGPDDGLVTTDQSTQMAAALNLVGVPTHLYTVILKGEGESGTTVTGNVLGEDGSPFAGHGWEGSDTHLVIATGFEQLFVLLDGGGVAPGLTPVPGN